jgi:hypothetical protein
MSLPAFQDRCSEAEVVSYLVRLLGTGASAPTKEYGQNITVTRLGVGNYRLTFTDGPGTFLGFTPGLEATTNANLKGCTVVATTWDSTNKRLDIQLYDSAFAARELANTGERINLTLNFKQTGV